jgi:hypothetical protein
VRATGRTLKAPGLRSDQRKGIPDFEIIRKDAAGPTVSTAASI